MLSPYPGGYRETQRCRRVQGAIERLNVVAVSRGLSRDSTLSPYPGGYRETQRCRRVQGAIKRLDVVNSYALAKNILRQFRVHCVNTDIRKAEGMKSGARRMPIGSEKDADREKWEGITGGAVQQYMN